MVEAALPQSTNERFMGIALQAARRGLVAGEPPIGACLVKGGEVIVALHNAVISELDITAHAEMRVIREACRQLRKLELSGCQMFVTVEPCPMCMSACHYAAIAEVIYGARLADMHALTGNELMVSHAGWYASSATKINVSGDCLRGECRALLEEWISKSGAR
jgi:guanine deaminase